MATRFLRTRFPLGRVVATPGALAALGACGGEPYTATLIARHHGGDWGDLSDDDRRANDRALDDGDRLFSAYDLPTGGRVWIITEADRSATTLLLPTDY
jgi:hypothetical protein